MQMLLLTLTFLFLDLVAREVGNTRYKYPANIT